MGGVRMSEDEGDEKERSIISPCFQNHTHACAQAHIYMCRYIHVHLHQLVQGCADMHALVQMYTYACEGSHFLGLSRTHAHSQLRRAVNAVGAWFPSLHTHSSLSRGPDRTFCPTGHGSTHTHKDTHILTL